MRIARIIKRPITLTFLKPMNGVNYIQIPKLALTKDTESTKRGPGKVTATIVTVVSPVLVENKFIKIIIRVSMYDSESVDFDVEQVLEKHMLNDNYDNIEDRYKNTNLKRELKVIFRTAKYIIYNQIFLFRINII